MTSFINFNVLLNALSVSPGNPIIKSEEKAISSLTILNLLIMSKYNFTLYPLFILFKISSSPDCIGKCKYGIKKETSPCALIKSSLISIG